MIKPSIFISFAFADWENARVLLDALKSDEHSFFVAKREIVPGRSFVRWMNRAIGCSNLLLLMWSRDAAASRFVNDEWTAFYSLRTKEKIFLVLLDDTPIPPLLADCIRFQNIRSKSELNANFQKWVSASIEPIQEEAAVLEEFEGIPSSIKDAELQLSAARNESSASKAISLLMNVIRQGNSLIADAPESAAIIVSSALNELALLETVPSKRSQWRHESVAVCQKAFRQSSVASIAATLANRVVDTFYDNWITQELPYKNKILAETKQLLKDILKTESKPTSRATLLVQLSSILRCQAQIEPKGKPTKARALEALRAAEAAVQAVPLDAGAKLELGQAFWSAARSASSEADFFRYMNKAEKILHESDDGTSVLHALVQARFYRQTYRPVAAYESFCDYVLRETHLRRMLATSYIVSESAMQMWYGKYDASFVKMALKTSQKILHQAIDSGYENARLLVDLARIEAALDSQPVAESLLSRLYIQPSSSWTEALTLAIDAVSKNQTDLLLRAFKIGLIDASVWNALGTFVRDSLSDNKLALRFYETGRKLNPSDPVLLTNIARTHVDIGDNESLVQAKMAVEKARDNADRSFVWWRDVSSKIEILKQIRKEQLKSRLGTKYKYRPRLADICRDYQEIVSLNETTERDAALTSVLINLLTISFGPHDIRVNKSNPFFIEFSWRSDLYIVAPFFSEKPVENSEISNVLEISKMQMARIIVISFSGFTDKTYTIAKSILPDPIILLIDKEEIDLVFRAAARLDSLLDKKLVEIYAIMNKM